MTHVKLWLWLTTRKGIQSRHITRLLEYFEHPERIYYADPALYDQVPDLSPGVKESLKRKDTGEAERILERCARLGVRILTLQDTYYPARLKEIYDPPAVLYLRGRRMLPDDEPVIAMVGARDATEYGRRVAQQLSWELVRSGATVVSGIARGIDAAVLTGALRAGGPVVSVLAGGADVYYPVENRGLYEAVAEHGVLVGEYPPGTRNFASNFPLRNRIISGLSLGVVAVQCKQASGTSITMSLAQEQNRDIFAVPGPLGLEQSEGPNALLRDGAILVRNARDILEEYQHLYPLPLQPLPEGRIQPLPEGRVPEPQTPAPSPAPRRAPVEKLIPQQPKAAHPPEPEQMPRSQPEQPSQPETVPAPDAPRQIPWESCTEEEQGLLRALETGSGSIDELVERSGIPARRVSACLTLLQLRGLVREEAGKRFSLER